MSGFTGISIAGRWECGSCGASGHGWWNEDDGLVIEITEDDGTTRTVPEHLCD